MVGYLNEVFSLHEEIKEIFDKDNKEIISVVLDELELINSAARKIPHNNKYPNFAGANAIQLTRIFNSLLSAYILISKGLIGETLLFLRAIGESQDLIELFIKEPHLTEKYFDGKNFESRDVRNKLDKTEFRKGRHRLFSGFIHPNLGYATTVINDGIVHAGGIYKPEEIANCLKLMALAGGYTLGLCREFIENNDDQEFKLWLRKSDYLVSTMGKYDIKE